MGCGKSSLCTDNTDGGTPYLNPCNPHLLDTRYLKKKNPYTTIDDFAVPWHFEEKPAPDAPAVMPYTYSKRNEVFSWCCQEDTRNMVAEEYKTYIPSYPTTEAGSYHTFIASPHMYDPVTGNDRVLADDASFASND